MKHSLISMLLAVVLASTLAACGESEQEKLAKQELERREKEVQRMNAMGKARDEAYAKILGTPHSAQKESMQQK